MEGGFRSSHIGGPTASSYGKALFPRDDLSRPISRMGKRRRRQSPTGNAFTLILVPVDCSRSISTENCSGSRIPVRLTRITARPVHRSFTRIGSFFTRISTAIRSLRPLTPGQAVHYGEQTATPELVGVHLLRLLPAIMMKS